MKQLYRTLVSLGLLLLAACADMSPLDMNAINDAEVLNLRAPETRVMSSGQPTEEQLRVMAGAGVRHIINLRTPEEETDFEERAVVESLGMSYHSIPVAAAGGITSANARSLQDILDEIGGEPTLVHCASGNRVGGLFAVSAFDSGAGLDSAMAEGARWGMVSERTRQVVRENLSGN